MTDVKRDPSCEERIESHKTGRLSDVRDLGYIADHGFHPGDTERPPLVRVAELIGCAPEPIADDDPETTREAAIEALDVLPLGVSSYTVFRIDLSTGGPADWLEVFCTGDTPNYEPEDGDGAHYEPTRIVYHFSDWFDHAERVLVGDDYRTAEEFARRVVPELIS